MYSNESSADTDSILCTKERGNHFPKEVNCSGITFYRSHEAIAKTTALLLTQACGKQSTNAEYSKCRENLLKEITRSYEITFSKNSSQ